MMCPKSEGKKCRIKSSSNRSWATDFCWVDQKQTCVSSCCRVGYVLTCLQYDISCLESKSRYINYASIWGLIYVIQLYTSLNE